MIAPGESTVLLALVALVLAQRALGVAAGIGVDCLVAATGAVTVVWFVDLPWTVLVFWLAVAAVCGDHVALAGHRRPGRDPLLLLSSRRSQPAYTAMSLVGALVWSAGLVLVGRAVGHLLLGQLAIL